MNINNETSAELRFNRPVVLSPNPPLPHNMLMELANICNHNCVFCGYKNMKRPKTKCDKKLMLDIIKQAYGGGTREIGFYMIGEPLICPDLADYISYAHSLGYEYIYLTTNGALATIDKMKELISAGLNSIKFSVNAGTRETYYKVHGKDDFEIVKSNIINLHKYVTENFVDLKRFISFVKVEINKNDIEKLKAEFENFVDKIYIFQCINQAGGMLQLIEQGIVKSEDMEEGSSLPCNMVFNRLHVTAEGYLSACCSDVDGYLSAIDLRTTSLYEAWNSDILVGLRNKHLQGNLKGTLCHNCIHNVCEPVKALNQNICPVEC